MRRSVQTAAFLGMVALIPLVAGCVPTALMVDQALEARAEDSRVFLAGLDRVWPATLTAMRNLQVGVTRNIRDNLGGDIDGVWPDGNAVSIRLEQPEVGRTRVTVRVGGVRNRDAPNLIFAKITDNL
jgi:hypothetical protein